MPGLLQRQQERQRSAWAENSRLHGILRRFDFGLVVSHHRVDVPGSLVYRNIPAERHGAVAPREGIAVDQFHGATRVACEDGAECLLLRIGYIVEDPLTVVQSQANSPLHLAE